MGFFGYFSISQPLLSSLYFGITVTIDYSPEFTETYYFKLGITEFCCFRKVH